MEAQFNEDRKRRQDKLLNDLDELAKMDRKMQLQMTKKHHKVFCCKTGKEDGVCGCFFSFYYSNAFDCMTDGIILDVPFCDKDKAKAQGARWSVPLKTWFIHFDHINALKLHKIYNEKKPFTNMDLQIETTSQKLRNLRSSLLMGNEL